MGLWSSISSLFAREKALKTMGVYRREDSVRRQLILKRSRLRLGIATNSGKNLITELEEFRKDLGENCNQRTLDTYKQLLYKNILPKIQLYLDNLQNVKNDHNFRVNVANPIWTNGVMTHKIETVLANPESPSFVRKTNKILYHASAAMAAQVNVLIKAEEKFRKKLS